MSVQDLSLNCDVINDEFLSKSPFRLVSVDICYLEANISYSSLLYDGCKVKVRGVDVCIVPRHSDKAEHNVPSNSKGTGKGRDEKGVNPSESVGVNAKDKANEKDHRQQPPCITEEGQEGLQFIAHWIEVVASRLQVQLDDLCFKIYDAPLNTNLEDQSQKIKDNQRERKNITYMTVRVGTSIFYNTHPQHIQGNSMSASVKLCSQTGASSFLSNVSKKLLTLKDIYVSVSSTPIKYSASPITSSSTSSTSSSSVQSHDNLNTKEVVVMQCAKEKEIVLQFREDNRFNAHSISIDCSASTPLLCQLDDTFVLPCIFILLGSYSSIDDNKKENDLPEGNDEEVLSDAAMRTILWLERQIEGKRGPESKDPSSLVVDLNGKYREGNEGLNVDYSKVVQLIKKYKLAKETISTSVAGDMHGFPPPVSLAYQSNTVIEDDDVDFPTDDENESDNELHESRDEDESDVSESQFLDTLERSSNVRRVRMSDSVAANRQKRQGTFASSMHHSVYGGATSDGSKMFHSALDGQVTASGSTARRNETSFSLRVHFASANIEFFDGKLHESIRRQSETLEAHTNVPHAKSPLPSSGQNFGKLSFKLEDLVVGLHATPTAPTSATLSVACFSAFEESIERNPSVHPISRPLLTMSHSLEQHRIINPPQLELIVQFRPPFHDHKTQQPASVHASLTIEPAVISIHLQNIIHWVSLIEGAVNVQTQESASNFTFELIAPSVDIVAHTPSIVPSEFWCELHDAMNLHSEADRWEDVDVHSCVSTHYESSNGGIRVLAKNLRVLVETTVDSLKSREPESKNTVEMDSISLNLFLRRDKKDSTSLDVYGTFFSEAKLFEALGSLNNKISMKRGWTMKVDNPPPSSVSSEKNGMLIPPKIDDSCLLHLRAHCVILDMRQREYNTLIAVIKAITETPPIPANEVYEPNSPKFNPSNSTTTPSSTSNGGMPFGIILQSDVGSLTLSRCPKMDDVSASELNAPSHQDVPSSQSGSSSPTDNDVTFYSLHMEVVQPVIEMLSTRQQTYVGIVAEDFAIFETSMSNGPYAEWGERGLPLSRDRDKLNSHALGSSDRPFLHRTTLHVSSTINNTYSSRSRSGSKDTQKHAQEHKEDQYKDFSGGMRQFSVAPSISSQNSERQPHVFGFQLLMTDEIPSKGNDLGTRSMAFHMDFQDVSLRFDPTSSWIMRAVELLTPLTPAQQLEARENRRLKRDKMLRKEQLRKGIDPSLLCQKDRDNTHNQSVGKTDHSAPSPKVSSSKIFEVTRVSVSVRKCLIDYGCQLQNSRILVSVGLLTMSSTIVSSSPSFRLKFVVEDFNLFLSNKLLDDASPEQTPLRRFGTSERARAMQPQSYQKSTVALDFDTFIDAHSFVQIATVDRLENIVSFLDSSGVALALRFTLNQCCMYGCVDSLDVLSATLLQLWIDFKSANSLEDEDILDDDVACDEGAEDVEGIDEKIDEADSRNGDEGNTKRLTGGKSNSLLPRHHNVSLSPSWLDEVENNSPFMAHPIQVARPYGYNDSNTSVNTTQGLQNFNVHIASTSNLNQSFGVGQRDASHEAYGFIEEFIPRPSTPPIPVSVISPAANPQTSMNSIHLPKDDLRSSKTLASERSASPEPETRWLADYDYDAYDADILDDFSQQYEGPEGNFGVFGEIYNPDESSNQETTEDKVKKLHPKVNPDHSGYLGKFVEEEPDLRDGDSDDEDVDEDELSGLDNSLFIPAESAVDLRRMGSLAGSFNFKGLSSAILGFPNKKVEEERELKDFREGMFVNASVDEKVEINSGNLEESGNIAREIVRNNVELETQVGLGTSETNDQNVMKLIIAHDEEKDENSAIQVLIPMVTSPTHGDKQSQEIWSAPSYEEWENPYNDHNNVLMASSSSSLSSSSSTINSSLPNLLSITQANQIHALQPPPVPLMQVSHSNSTSMKKDTIHMSAEREGLRASDDAQDLKLAWQSTSPVSLSSPPIPSPMPTSTSTSTSIPMPPTATASTGMRSVPTKEAEQKAGWFVHPDFVNIQHHYVPLVAPDHVEEEFDNIPPAERSLPKSVTVAVRVSHLRLRLYGGRDWTPPPTVPSNTQSTTSVPSTSKMDRLEELLSIPEPLPLHRDGRAAGGRETKTGSLFNKSLPASRPLLSASVPRKTRALESYLDLLAADATLALKIYNTKGKSQNAPELVINGGTETAEQPKDDSTSVEPPPSVITPPSPSSTNAPNQSNLPHADPVQRITLGAKECALVFARAGHRNKKIFGSWKSPHLPRDLGSPMILVSLVGYATASTNTVNGCGGGMATSGKDTVGEEEIEHRVTAAIVPLRVYLDENFFDFCKVLAALVSQFETEKKQRQSDRGTGNTKEGTCHAANNAVYFQQLVTLPIDLKIDYTPGPLKLAALQAGDYLQLLNIFPLDGLMLTLKQTRLGGVSGMSSAFERLVECWIHDIYANQAHRVISGTAPFRGLSNIGAGLHDLMLIPMKDYRRTGGVLRELKKGTSALLRTITKEALHGAHKLTMLVAKAIAELASDTPDCTKGPGGTAISKQQSRIAPRLSSAYRATHQPETLGQGLSLAADSISREVGNVLETIVAIPIKQYQRTGPGGYVKAVIRALPIAILRPVGGAAEAVSYTLLGLRNGLDPAQMKEEEDQFSFDLGRL